MTKGTSARQFGALGVAGLALAAIILLERFLGFRSPMFAFTMHFTLMGGAATIDQLLAPRLDSRRFDVYAGELRLYRRLGVVAFMRLLQKIGWSAMMRDRRIFDGTRRTLASYEQATRHGENAHAWLFAIALAPIAWAIARGWWDAAIWIGSMNVIFHVYPIMLQRTQRARLVALLRRSRQAGAP